MVRLWFVEPFANGDAIEIRPFSRLFAGVPLRAMLKQCLAMAIASRPDQMASFTITLCQFITHSKTGVVDAARERVA